MKLRDLLIQIGFIGYSFHNGIEVMVLESQFTDYNIPEDEETPDEGSNYIYVSYLPEYERILEVRISEGEVGFDRAIILGDCYTLSRLIHLLKGLGFDKLPDVIGNNTDLNQLDALTPDGFPKLSVIMEDMKKLMSLGMAPTESVGKFPGMNEFTQKFKSGSLRVMTDFMDRFEAYFSDSTGEQLMSTIKSIDDLSKWIELMK